MARMEDIEVTSYQSRRHICSPKPQTRLNPRLRATRSLLCGRIARHVFERKLRKLHSVSQSHSSI